MSRDSAKMGDSLAGDRVLFAHARPFTRRVRAAGGRTGPGSARPLYMRRACPTKTQSPALEGLPLSSARSPMFQTARVERAHGSAMLRAANRASKRARAPSSSTHRDGARACDAPKWARRTSRRARDASIRVLRASAGARNPSSRSRRASKCARDGSNSTLGASERARGPSKCTFGSSQRAPRSSKCPLRASARAHEPRIRMRRAALPTCAASNCS